MQKLTSKQIYNMSGLKKKPTFEELIKQVEADMEEITYPDRKAELVRGSFVLSALDGAGEAKRELAEKLYNDNLLREMLLRQLATSMGIGLGNLGHITHAPGYVPQRRHDPQRCWSEP